MTGRAGEPGRDPGAFIFGCSGPELTVDEAAFFADAQPWGFIIFTRNVEDPDQLRALTNQLRDAVGREAPILVDQEGGRVERLTEPHWRSFIPALEAMERAPPGEARRAMWLRGRLIADDLHGVGIDVNCAPLADLVEKETHPVLRNRLYGDDPVRVVRAARAMAEGLLAGGVLPVLKHLPGYGRASVDSHKELPRISVPEAELRRRDFAPFAALGHMAMGMSAHVIYEDIDPDHPATASRKMIDLIRKDLYFSGLLMTDDISMGALSGSIGERSQAAIAAGCDLVLHCNGRLPEMEEVAATAGRLSDAAVQRAAKALSQRQKPDEIDSSALEAELEALTGGRRNG